MTKRRKSILTTVAAIAVLIAIGFAVVSGPGRSSRGWKLDG